MRIATDGYLDLRDTSMVRTPGAYDDEVEPLPERRALTFLLSHAFPGPRTIVRPLSERNRRTLQKAIWADSVNDRMNLVDRVWRDITQPVPDPDPSDEPQLLQIVLYGEEWAFPLYLDGGTMQVLPEGGLPVGKVKRRKGAPRIDVQSA